MQTLVSGVCDMTKDEDEDDDLDRAIKPSNKSIAEAMASSSTTSSTPIAGSETPIEADVGTCISSKTYANIIAPSVPFQFLKPH